MAPFAISWILRQSVITSVLMDASRSRKVLDAIGSLQAAPLSDDEIARVEEILGD
jgi:L-glyceraldehyde 3-phosphate reductase